MNTSRSYVRQLVARGLLTRGGCPPPMAAVGARAKLLIDRMRMQIDSSINAKEDHDNEKAHAIADFGSRAQSRP